MQKRLQIGARLKEERTRLRLSQSEIADSLGVSRRSVIDWEKGGATPNAENISDLYDFGVDVLYTLTGRREPEPFSTEEKLLVERYRAADEATRYRILSSLLEGKTVAQAATDSNQVTQTITGMAGQVAGRDIKNKG
ncbi:helix-turn-helix transcriptional regulator [Halothiobacillus sp.]|uniref:helix-turn-helix domain-containing protein n=1 Tax=Halothiobacillus sp. TaxID=1891311 RepID=UPI0026178645|nr:helix-turn-helix transcriptional regulator [Halothiobacillus sp.]MDD4967465.1 helix-turn-helix transcriptional regulator [Halothiobacillus sp.]